MQYDTPTHWQTGEERADTAGAKSAAARTHDDDAFFDFPSTLGGNIHGQWCDWIFMPYSSNS